MKTALTALVRIGFEGKVTWGGVCGTVIHSRGAVARLLVMTVGRSSILCCGRFLWKGGGNDEPFSGKPSETGQLESVDLGVEDGWDFSFPEQQLRGARPADEVRTSFLGKVIGC